ncbi:MAG: DUF4249 domain-containing protein [Saprospiraceae bacterium]|uniref:DUF4249 domain-containing protein n=1 Tax=Candidatus Opimibacter skivensis TaxID=2982028 RepID=A0A9D7SQR3_9BACT|nr:DUF4249 domain-containing protein [Candidatus Opimibacter skivensis]
MIPICILLLSAGCETTIDFQSKAEPKLTIISQISPILPSSWDEAQRVYVYASQSASDSSLFYTPDNLTVFVTEIESGISIQLVFVTEDGKTFYKIPDGFLKAGFNYTISAHASGFDDVQATTAIPSPSTIRDLSIKTISIEQSELNDFKKNIRYTLQFRINHTEPNQYYHLVFYNAYDSLSARYLVDPELSDNQLFIHHYDYGVLINRNDLTPDQLLTFNFVDWTIGGHDLKTVYVELRSITEEYYKYHSSLARQLIVRQDPFAEPVTIFNNIKGGYGNFSGFASSTASSDLPK